MKTAYATLTILAGLILAAGAVGQAPETDSLTTASIAPVHAPDRFRLLSSGEAGECRLSVGQAAKDATKRPLQLAQACLADHPGLAGAHYWVEQADGAIALSEVGGHVLARFAAADGAAFESYYPTLPVMTLLAVE